MQWFVHSGVVGVESLTLLGIICSFRVVRKSPRYKPRTTFQLIHSSFHFNACHHPWTTSRQQDSRQPLCPPTQERSVPIPPTIDQFLWSCHSFSTTVYNVTKFIDEVRPFASVTLNNSSCLPRMRPASRRRWSNSSRGRCVNITINSHASEAD